MRIRAWREIFDAVEPDLLYAEYSPGALIASRGLGIPQVTIGNGFMTPPVETRDGVFAPYATTPGDSATLARLEKDDARVLDVLNEGCRRAGVPAFNSLGEIMGQAERCYLTTLPELDHFDWRNGGCYLGMHPPFGDAEPQWPVAGGARVFCYLQDFPGLSILLKELTDAGASLLVYRREASEQLSQQFARVPNIRFTSEPLDLSKLPDSARFVVHHAGQGVAVQCFEYGVPQLCIPTQQEQLLTAYQLERTGVGMTALHNQQSFSGEIAKLMQDEDFQRRARLYRDRYADFNWADSERRIVADMATILGS